MRLNLRLISFVILFADTDLEIYLSSRDQVTHYRSSDILKKKSFCQSECTCAMKDEFSEKLLKAQ